MSFRRICCAQIAWILMLSGCGGGGSNGSPPPVAAGTEISGKVIDGYLHDFTFRGRAPEGLPPRRSSG